MARRERPFKGRQFTSEVILWAVRWHLQFPISYRDLELMLRDRSVSVDHTTIYRWIQASAVELEKRLRPDHRFPTQRPARCPGRQALLQESSGPVEHGQSADCHGRQERRLSKGRGRPETGQADLALLQAAPDQVLEQLS
jgi:hypothetical protein